MGREQSEMESHTDAIDFAWGRTWLRCSSAVGRWKGQTAGAEQPNLGCKIHEGTLNIWATTRATALVALVGAPPLPGIDANSIWTYSITM
uniref:Uncharacterized protein n=1 Tax=Arundo donax TaxID=35708 RepID=A0A0A8Y4N3_ARUDO